jgi:type I restriction enzyme S subunit
MTKALAMPDTWKIATLEEVTDPVRTISYGILKPGPDIVDGVPYVRVVNMREGQIAVRDLRHTSYSIAKQYARTRLVPGDVLISIRGTYGKVAIVPAELDGANITQDTARLAFMEGIDPKFAALYLQTREVQSYLKQVARGVAVKGVNIRDLRATPFPVPPLAEQQRIVAALEEHLSGLEVALNTIKSTRDRSGSLRASLLRGELSKFDATDPKWTALGDIAESIRNGIFVSRPGKEPRGVPILRISSVRPMRLDIGDIRYSELEVADVAQKGALLSSGDLLFTRYNGNPEYVGSCAVVAVNAGPLTYPDKLIRVRLHPGVAIPGFVAATFAWSKVRARVRSVVKTTAGQAGISARDLRSIQIPLPPLAEQERIVAALEVQLSRLDAAIATIDSARTRSERLRRSLLAQAFSGQLVTEDPRDEPAAELLARIGAERISHQGPHQTTRSVKRMRRETTPQQGTLL